MQELYTDLLYRLSKTNDLRCTDLRCTIGKINSLLVASTCRDARCASPRYMSDKNVCIDGELFQYMGDVCTVSIVLREFCTGSLRIYLLCKRNREHLFIGPARICVGHISRRRTPCVSTGRHYHHTIYLSNRTS